MAGDLFFPTAPEVLPRVGDPGRAAIGFEHWQEQTARLTDPGLAQFAENLAKDPDGRRLLDALFANSEFLTHSAISDLSLIHI